MKARNLFLSNGAAGEVENDGVSEKIA